jgi:hypothetical protein
VDLAVVADGDIWDALRKEWFGLSHHPKCKPLIGAAYYGGFIHFIRSVSGNNSTVHFVSSN